MTHKDTTMLERLARVAQPYLWAAIDRSRFTPEGCETVRKESIDRVRAILNELKHPSEGMIAAMHRDFMSLYSTSLASSFTAAMDFVLNEGEGNTTS